VTAVICETGAHVLPEPVTPYTILF
jgi:hypothetical protein